MGKKRTTIMTEDTYKTILQVSRNGLYLSTIDIFLMLLLSFNTKSMETIYYEGGVITSSTSLLPLYSSCLFHVLALFLFKLSSSKISEADQGEIHSGKYPNNTELDKMAGIDFAKYSFKEVLEPVGSGSNQWFVFWGFGLTVSVIGSLIGSASAIFATVDVAIPRIMMGQTIDFISFFLEPYVILCVIAAIIQLFTIVKIPTRGLLVIPKILQYSLDQDWSQDLRKSLRWRLKKPKSLESELNDCQKIPWKIKQKIQRKTTMQVFCTLEEAFRNVMDHLCLNDAKILHHDTHQIVAEHGSEIWWEPKDAKKKIFVEITEVNTGSNRISVNLKFPLFDTLFTYTSPLIIIFLSAIAYQFEPAIGIVIGLFLIPTFSLLIVWYIFEKDSIVRDLWYRFYDNGILEEKQTDDLIHKENDIVDESADFLVRLVSKLDNVYRIIFGDGIIRSQDFPFMPIYLFRDYRSSLFKYGKTANYLKSEGEERSEFDFADTTSRLKSEIQLKESGRYCDVVYNDKIIASKVTKPTEILKNLRIIGRPSSILPLSPWSSLIVIGIGVLLFFVSFYIEGEITSKIPFLLIISFGLWIICGTILILIFENSSTLAYTSGLFQILVMLGVFPLIISVSYFLLQDGSYPLKVGMDLWAISAIFFGISVAGHTSGKPFSKSLYFYTQEPEYFPYDEREDSPYWLTAKSYWVYRFVLQWLWELTIPPYRDYERLEIWVDAESGKLEWVVTDYHYRELWYKIPPDSHEIISWWDSNFHSFHPLLDRREIQLFKKLKGNYHVNSKYREKMQRISDERSKQHPVEIIEKFFEGFEKLGSKKCAKLPWKYWRYSFGAYPKKKYSRWKKYSVDHEGHGAALKGEQFD